MNGLRALIATVCMGVSLIVSAQPVSPVPMLDNAATKIITTLKENKASLNAHHQIIHQAVERYLLPIVDVDGMARSVLGRQAWTRATAAEKKAFTAAFTQLVIRTYAGPLSKYTDETVKFLPLRGTGDGRFIRVNSLIVRSSGQNIPLMYSLVAKGDQWKIYDLSVEGVSLLQSFRTQFGQALQTGSMNALIATLNQRNKGV